MNMVTLVAKKTPQGASTQVRVAAPDAARCRRACHAAPGGSWLAARDVLQHRAYAHLRSRSACNRPADTHEPANLHPCVLVGYGKGAEPVASHVAGCWLGQGARWGKRPLLYGWRSLA
jgi:hypothetical protein